MNKELQAKLRCKKKEYRRGNIESGIRDRQPRRNTAALYEHAEMQLEKLKPKWN